MAGEFPIENVGNDENKKALGGNQSLGEQL
jgi:hypothetical protein